MGSGPAKVPACQVCGKKPLCESCKGCQECYPIRNCQRCLLYYQPNIRINMEFDKIRRMYDENLKINNVSGFAATFKNQSASGSSKRRDNDGTEHLILEIQVEYPTIGNQKDHRMVIVDGYRGNRQGQTKGKIVARFSDLGGSSKIVTNVLQTTNNKGIRDLYKYLKQNVHGKSQFDYCDNNCYDFAEKVITYLVSDSQERATAIKKMQEHKIGQLKNLVNMTLK